MARRSASDRERKWLSSELREWLAQGIVTQEQATQIEFLYESPVELAERKQSIALLTLTGIAAFMVALGVLLLIGYNWEAMPDALRLATVFGVLAGTYLAAFALRFRSQARLQSEVAFFFGCLCYGAAIFLIAQIFHRNGHYPDGVWWWALGVLPFALCLDTMLLHALLVSLLAIWCGMEIIGFRGLGFWLFGRWGILGNGAYTLPLFALPGLVWAYRKGSLATVSLYAALIAWWVTLQPLAWNFEYEIVYYIGAVGGLMLIVAEAHPAGSRFGIPYRVCGVLISGVVLMMMSFFNFNDRFPRYDSQLPFLILPAAIVGLAGFIIWTTSMLRVKLGNQLPSTAEMVQETVRRQWLPLGIVGAMTGLLLWQGFVHDPYVPTIVANIAIVCLALWLVAVGLRDDRGQPFTGGVLLFLLWTVIRYIDLFGDFGGMVGAALMFFLCGATLFGVATFWRSRKSKSK